MERAGEQFPICSSF